MDDSSTARIQRDTPQRGGPLRSATAMLRPGEPDPEPPPGARPGAAPSTAGRVESAVSTAYQVLEQAMRRGRDAARRYTSSAEGDSSMGSDRNGQDPRDPYTQAFRAWTNLFSTWADVLGPLMPPGMRPPWAPGAEAPEKAASEAPAQGLRLVLDTMSSRPVEVELDLQPAPPGTELAVQDLRSFEDGKPPITGARLQHLEGGRLKLHLRVPQEQPCGVYAGVVYDPAKSERRGSLTVRVLE